MSSSPETDADLTVTVKRVAGGLVSNWLLDNVTTGDVVEATRPAGVFCPQPSESPIVGFCGGSGITPVMSITKHVLATTTRPVRLLYANRDRTSVIFDDELSALRAHNVDRLEVRHHIDAEAGYLEPDDVAAFVGGDVDADFYICGPGAFMDLVDPGCSAWASRPTASSSNGSWWSSRRRTPPRCRPAGAAPRGPYPTR